MLFIDPNCIWRKRAKIFGQTLNLLRTTPGKLRKFKFKENYIWHKIVHNLKNIITQWKCMIGWKQKQIRLTSNYSLQYFLQAQMIKGTARRRIRNTAIRAVCQSSNRPSSWVVQIDMQEKVGWSLTLEGFYLRGSIHIVRFRGRNVDQATITSTINDVVVHVLKYESIQSSFRRISIPI